MSIRSNIIVEDDRYRIQLYRHRTGYPDGKRGVLATLEYAFPYAWPFPRPGASDPYVYPLPQFVASDFAAAIVRAWKTKGGGNIHIDGSPKAWEMIHLNADWVYIIKQKAPPKSKRGVTDCLSDEPVVEVYDWHKYWLEGADPHKVKPKPVARVKLLEARKTGLAWKY